MKVDETLTQFLRFNCTKIYQLTKDIGASNVRLIKTCFERFLLVILVVIRCGGDVYK